MARGSTSQGEPMTPSAPRMAAIEWLLLLLLALLWSGSFLFAKIAVAELPPLTLALGRVVLAALALQLALRATGGRMPTDRAAWAAFLVMGTLNNIVPFSLIFWGQTQIGSGLAAILNATTPLWTALIAHLATTNERLTPGRLAGVLTGLAGVAILIGPDALNGVGLGTAAQVAVLAAALSYGCAGVFGRRFAAMGLAPMQTAAGQLTSSSLLLLPIAALVDRPWSLPLPGPVTWAALVALALISTALAYVLFFRILARAGAVNVSLVTLLIPPAAMILGALVLGERFATAAFAGLALIASGLGLVDGRPLRWLAGATARRRRAR